MSLYCPIYTLTWYPGDYPSVTGGIVLQSGSHFADAYAGLAARVRDLVQESPFIRGDAPAFYNRGNRQTRFEWQEVRKYADPAEALTDGLDAIAAMPQTQGWLSIAIPNEGRAWAATPCLIESAGFPRLEKAGTDHLLRLDWYLLCGPFTAVATTAEEGAITAETGVDLLTEEGDYLALEALT
jgi:hypothetical protein